MNKVSAKMCVVVVFVFMPACVAYGENTKNLWINDPQIDIDVNYVYRSGNDNSFQQLNEGNVVKSGDSFKIIFTPKEDSYIYIFQIDSSGQVYGLFPMEGFKGVKVENRNPVQAGKTYYIPAEGKSFILDDVTGIEKIYFLASLQPDVKIEAQYQTLEMFQQRTDLTGDDLQRLDHMLDDLEDALEFKGRTKGIAKIGQDPNKNKQNWTEQGQTFSIITQRLEGLCDGCINVISFEHQ